MPTYEFRCPNGHTFEQFHRINDSPSTARCPTCDVVAERMISGGAALVFKGSGFYLTDYGKNAHRTSGPAKEGDGAPGGGKEGAGKEGGGEKPAGDKAAGASGGASAGGAPSTSGGSSGSSSSGGGGSSSSGGAGPKSDA